MEGNQQMMVPSWVPTQLPTVPALLGDDEGESFVYFVNTTTWHSPLFTMF